MLFGEGIHFTLSGEENTDVIGEATDNEAALNLIEANPPRVAVLNPNRGKPSGIEVTHRIKQNLPSVSMVLTTDSDNEEQLFSAMKSVASAYVTKDIDPDELVYLKPPHINPSDKVLSLLGAEAKAVPEVEVTVGDKAMIGR